MTANLAGILGVEALTAAQGIDLRRPLETSGELQKAHAAIRRAVPELEVDRYMSRDIAAAAELVSSGALNASVNAAILPQLDSRPATM